MSLPRPSMGTLVLFASALGFLTGCPTCPEAQEFDVSVNADYVYSWSVGPVNEIEYTSVTGFADALCDGDHNCISSPYTLGASVEGAEVSALNELDGTIEAEFTQLDEEGCVTARGIALHEYTP